MSLVVWLPLTKDLRNQGLSNVAVTNNGATFNSAGKLGGCYSFSGSSQKIVNTLPSTVTSSVGSLSCWIKMNSLPGSSSFYNLLQLGNLGGYATCRLGLYMEYTNYINISIDGSGTSSNRYTHSMVANQWYHICVTYDGTIVKLYIDGNEVLSKTASKGSYTTAASNLYIGGTSSYYLNGYMNDARYYDHCLSPMEVKELAKGLILHYPLNRQGWGQENLFTENYWSYGSGWNVKNLINSSTSTIKPVVNADGSCTLTGGDASNSQCYCANSGYKVSLEPNTTYTISVKITTNGPCNFRVWWYDYDSSGTKLATYSTLSTTINGGITKLFTVTRTTVANTASCYWELNLYGTPSTSTCVMHAKSLKLEEGSIATPWCPNSSDALYTTMGLNSTTEYDCSGFCNNSTRIGTFNWTSDTPKYGVSTKFNNNEIINTSFPIIQSQNHLTLAAWIKLNAYTSDRSMICLANQFYLTINSNGKLSGYCYGKSPSGYYDSNGTIPLNNWTHIALTWDSSNVKFYINGILDKTLACTGTSDTTNYGFHIGRENTSRAVNGNISDVRIYATALSADDVKSLYQNCATIDPDGTIRGQIRN